MMNHVQTMYYFDSMVTRLHFSTLSMEHASGISYNADNAGLE